MGMTGGGDPRQPLRSQQGQVDGGGVDQQALVGADIGSGTGPADVLLPGLKGQGIADFAVQVLGAAGDTPRQLAHQRLLAAQETGIGAAGGKGHAEGLGLATGDVRAPAPPFTGG